MRVKNSYHQLAYHYESADEYDDAFDYTKKAGDFAMSNKDYNLAVSEYKRLLTMISIICDQNDREIAQIHYNLAYSYLTQNHFTIANEHIHIALNLLHYPPPSNLMSLYFTNFKLSFINASVTLLPSDRSILKEEYDDSKINPILLSAKCYEQLIGTCDFLGTAYSFNARLLFHGFSTYYSNRLLFWRSVCELVEYHSRFKYIVSYENLCANVISALSSKAIEPSDSDEVSRASLYYLLSKIFFQINKIELSREYIHKSLIYFEFLQIDHSRKKCMTFSYFLKFILNENISLSSTIYEKKPLFFYIEDILSGSRIYEDICKSFNISSQDELIRISQYSDPIIWRSFYIFIFIYELEKFKKGIEFLEEFLCLFNRESILPLSSLLNVYIVYHCWWKLKRVYSNELLLTKKLNNIGKNIVNVAKYIGRNIIGTKLLIKSMEYNYNIVCNKKKISIGPIDDIFYTNNLKALISVSNGLVDTDHRNTYIQELSEIYKNNKNLFIEEYIRIL